MMAPMTAHPTVDALRHLATLVTQRRLQLGLDKIDVARSAGITITTYNKIEAGLSVRESSYGKVERAIGWAPGSALDILAGAPTPTLVTEHVGLASTSPVVKEDISDDIAAAVQDAAIHVSDGLTAPEIRNLKVRVVELLRERGKLPPVDES